MSLLFCESFDWLAASSDETPLVGKWSSVATELQIHSTGRNGNAIGNQGGQGGDRDFRKSFPNADKHATFIAGAAWFPNTLSTNSSLIAFRGDDNATTHITITTDGSGRLQAKRGTSGGTVLGTTNIVYSAGGWYYLEVKVTLSDTVGAVTIRVNGATALSLTNVDTKNAGTATTLDSVSFFGHFGGVAEWDDIYICNAVDSGISGTPNNDFIGDIRVECLVPNGNGNSSQGTGSDGNSTDNYLLVDEKPPNDDTDYVEIATDDQKDTYAFENLASSAGSIAGVQVTAKAKKTDTGAKSIRLISRLSTDEVDNGADLALSTSYAYFLTVFQDTPAAGSTAWTRQNVDDAEFGWKARP